MAICCFLALYLAQSRIAFSEYSDESNFTAARGFVLIFDDIADFRDNESTISIASIFQFVKSIQVINRTFVLNGS